MTYGVGGNRLSQLMTPEGNAADTAARSAIAAAIGKTYFQSDYLGSVLFADNAQGEILRYAERDSWGNTELSVLFDMNTAGVENSIQFTSHPYDAVIGKYFAEARFYDAETGRFMAKDPIKTGVNLYPYVQNNPVKLIDPDGESLLSFIAAIGGAVTGGAYGALAYFDEQQKQHEKFNLLDFAKTTLKSAGIGGAKMLLASVVPGYGTGPLAEIGLGITGNQAGNMLTGKGNFTDAVKNTMDSYFGIDRASLFPAKPRPAKEQAIVGAGQGTGNTGTGKNGTGNAQNNDFTKRRNTSPYNPPRVTDSIALGVRPGTIPSANPTVDNRNPKEACGDGSNYGYGAGSAGPLKTVPGKNNIVKDVIRSTIEITAGVVATAVVGTVLGVGASKLLRALKPVGRGIVQGALSAGRNLFKGILGKKSQSDGTIRNRIGKSVSPTKKTIDMALDPETYAYAIAKKYGINLRGSGQNIEIKYNPNIRTGTYGLTRNSNPNVIEIGPTALVSEEELANTIAHELNHARDFLRGGPAIEPPAYKSGNALADYIRGGR